MNDHPILALDHISTRFGKTPVHHNISLRIGVGEAVGLVGGSGSGKTTLLRAMTGLHRPHEGEIRVFGYRLWDPREDTPALRRRWGVLFQGGALFSALTVYDNVAFPLRELHGLDEALVAELVTWKLQSVGLDPGAGERLPAELSGGMVKRAALARAVVLEPELLFLDEPTAGLDPPAARSFIGLIRSLRARLGLTILMVSHDIATLTALCDRIAVLAGGGIVADAPPATLRKLANPVVRDFLAPPDGD